MKRLHLPIMTLSLLAALALSGCSSTREPQDPIGYTPIPAELSLPDRVSYAQKDPRWAREALGGSGESLASDGCLVTAAAMALGNLGYKTDPGDLNKRLKKAGGFTKQGWLIWSAIGTVTEGGAKARFYNTVSADIIDGCMADGYYPLARFILPNGRSHWAMIVSKSKLGYHMRDPLHPSRQPLIFPRGVDAFKAVRCVGPSAAAATAF